MKYQDLKEALIQMINDGTAHSPDGRFLSERQIAETFDVSRTTVRRAITDLQKQGYLLSIHGKGTYVKRRNRAQSIYSIIRCTQHYAEMGLHPSTQVLEQVVVPATDEVAASLKIQPGESCLRLSKLFQADRMLFNVTVSHMPLSRFPNLERVNLSSVPILDSLRALYAAIPKRTEHSIEAILPPEEIAKYLKITATTPLLLFESVTSGSLNGQYVPFEHFKCYYRTDMLRFSFTQDHDSIY